MALLKNNEHFNVLIVRNLCKWKIVHFDGISYENVSEIFQTYFTNRIGNWIEIIREHCSRLCPSIFRVNFGYDLPWRPSRPSLVEACFVQGPPFFQWSLRPKQACNRASRNRATVVGGLSISLICAASGTKYVLCGLDQGSKQATAWP